MNSFYLTCDKDYKEFNIGNDFVMTSGDGYNPISRGLKSHINLEYDSILNIGNNVGISSSTIWCAKYISIGNNVRIGANCTILDTDCHSLISEVRKNEKCLSKKDHHGAKCLPVIIEDDVMIGANCLILKGVKIGSKSIVGAGSVVTKNIPEGSVVAGCPAKVIGNINVSN